MEPQLRVRPPAVAGVFYPDAAGELAQLVDGLLLAAAPVEGAPVPKALVVPHAGFPYSGPIAAAAWARLAPAAGRITRVVLLGPAHRVHLAGLALPEADALATPLGLVAVDAEAARRAGVPRVALAHAREHSLEVQLPFVQRALPGASVVPLVVGAAEPQEVARVLAALWGGPETAVVVSSDLSHYLPYDLGRSVDEATACQVLAAQAPLLRGDQACGAAPLNGLLEVTRERRMRAELLDLQSSGDTAGGHDEVVGYGAFAFHEV